VTARETAQDKARRYVLEARLLVTRVDGDTVLAECRGSGEIYHLGHAPNRGWFCSCAKPRGGGGQPGFQDQQQDRAGFISLPDVWVGSCMSRIGRHDCP
jgi:hypothetical protein